MQLKCRYQISVSQNLIASLDTTEIEQFGNLNDDRAIVNDQERVVE